MKNEKSQNLNPNLKGKFYYGGAYPYMWRPYPKQRLIQFLRIFAEDVPGFDLKRGIRNEKL